MLLPWRARICMTQCSRLAQSSTVMQHDEQAYRMPQPHCCLQKSQNETNSVHRGTSTYPDSCGLLLQNPDPIVASALLTHHGILSRQLCMLADFACPTVRALRPYKNNQESDRNLQCQIYSCMMWVTKCFLYSAVLMQNASYRVLCWLFVAWSYAGIKGLVMMRCAAVGRQPLASE